MWKTLSVCILFLSLLSVTAWFVLDRCPDVKQDMGLFYEIQQVKDENEALLRRNKSLAEQNLKLQSDLRIWSLVGKINNIYRNDNPYINNVFWVKRVVVSNLKWTENLKIDRSNLTLSNMIVESGLDPYSTGNTDDKYIGQTRERYIKLLLRKLKERGFNVIFNSRTIYHDVDTQVALSIMEFRDKLDASKEDYKTAIERYNGHGKNAMNHRRKVFKTYSKVFGGEG